MIEPGPFRKKPEFAADGSKTRSRFNQKKRFWFIILLIILILITIRYYNASLHNKNQGSQQVPVVSALAKTADIPVYVTALGSVTPTYSVTLKSQINGLLMRVLFQEGQMVRAGQLLAEIDPRPYEAQLVEFTGQLKRDEAQLVNAKIDLKRYQKLWKQNSVSEQTLATQIALVNQLKGTVQLDRGQIQTTKVNLVYCKITSPVDGRIGLRLVDPGNFVQTADTTGIAVINTLNPITVIFSVAEDNIPEIARQAFSGETLIAEAWDRQQNTLLATGKLLTLDNQISATTGTVNLRAQFPNETNILFPGQFVNIHLRVKTLQNATIVPTAAVQQSTKGTYVYILNPKTLTVSEKTVQTGITTGNVTVITAGVLPGQSVIEQGADQLTDGAKVTLSESGSSPNTTKG